jgi:hypothetical protein
MKAISIWQPWASAIFIGKEYETRGWKTPYRGLLLIHAAQTWNQVCKISLYELQDAGILPHSNGQDLYPLGVLLGQVELVDCLPTDTLKVGENEQRLGNFLPGRFAWKLANPQRFERPIACRGRQGIFEVSTGELEPTP